MKKIFKAGSVVAALALSGCDKHIDENLMHCTFDAPSGVMSVFNTITGDLVITVNEMESTKYGNYQSTSHSEFSLPENMTINRASVYLDDRQECEIWRNSNVDSYSTYYTLKTPEL